MVGEDTDVHIVVHEAGMHSVKHRRELYVHTFVVENGTYAVGLLHAVGKHKNALVLGYITAEAVDNEVEVLVVKRLRLCGERHPVGVRHVRAVVKLYFPETRHKLQEVVAIDVRLLVLLNLRFHRVVL